MDRWIVYVKERFPLSIFLLLIGGISLSGIYLERHYFQLIPFLISFTGIFLFFSLLRLIEDVKNLEKDRIAHKDRPLPRGLIKKQEATSVINKLLMILIAYCLLVWVLVGHQAAFAYAFLAGYLYLMDKEFYVGHWLVVHPILHGLMRQLVIFPLAIFAVTVANPDAVTVPSTWSFGLMLFGAFFCYEICCKLNPHMHPILATYVHYYGFRRTFEFATFTLALTAMGTISLNLGSLLIPVELTVLICLCLVFFQPLWYKIPEMAASLSLVLHIWVVVIHHYFE